MTRIPHTESPTEVRQGFQRLVAQTDVLTDGTSGQILIGAGVGVTPVWTDQSAIDHGGFGGLGDDDHTQYMLADGTRDFSGVVVGVFPVNSNHLATKEYVDQAINFVQEYYLTNTASDIGGIYYDMVELSTGEAESTFDSASLDTGNGQAVANWATIAGQPGVVVYEAGIYELTLNAAVIAGNKPTKLYFEVYRYEADTTETLIATSETTEYLTGSTVAYHIHASITSDVAVAATDRAVVKVLANVEASGSNVTIRLYAEGTNNSRFEIPTTTETLSSVFLRQDGVKDLTGNLAVDAGITIDGRDLSVDGTKLDGIEALADVTDATNVAAAGAAMAGGAYHDGFSDFVADEHIAHSGVSITAGDGLTGGGTIASTRTIDLDISKLSTVAIIASGDYVPFEQISPSVTNKKITFANFEGALNHDSLTGFVSNEHVDHSTVSISTSTGLSGGGTIAATRTLSLSHLGIESLSDPGADRIMFWDDGESACKWLTVSSTGVGLSGTTLTANAGYVDRGDPSGWDFHETTTPLTLDGTWRDMDLSSIVPAGAYAVQIRCFFRSSGSGAGQFGGFRKNGNSNAQHAVSQYTQSTGAMEMQGVLPCDSSRVIEYNAQNTLDIFRMVVKGWFI
jgi:hypothetical protein